MIAGHGTMGLEIVEQVPDLDAVLVPVGGGGLIAGVALAVKSLRPDALVYVRALLTLPHSTRSRVFVTIGCPSVRLSVCLSHYSTAAAACGGFASRRYPSTALCAGHPAARGRSTALSSKCGQCHVDRRVDEARHRLVLMNIYPLFVWTGLSVEESVRMTEDRDKWRKYVHGVANPRIEDG